MAKTQTADIADRRLVIQPNASLNARWAMVFMASMCAVSFGIAGVYAWFGMWMVLPFAGLEMAALGAGLWWSMRGNGYREVVSVTADRLSVEAGMREPQTRWDFQRAWARIELRQGPYRNSPTRLTITSHGRVCEIGRCLTDDQRGEVARRLQQWMQGQSGRLRPENVT